MAQRSKNAQSDAQALEDMRTSYQSTKRELEALKQLVGSPYPFDGETREKLLGVLRAIPPEHRTSIVVMFPSMGGGGAAAHKMVEAFLEAGWSAEVRSNMILRGELRGIHISCAMNVWQELVPMPAAAKLVMHVLSQAGIKYARTRPGGDDDLDDHFNLIVSATP